MDETRHEPATEPVRPLPKGVHESDCAHASDTELYCLRPRGHTGLHYRIASKWGDDGHAVLITDPDPALTQES